ncbi:MAG: peptidoglycan-associated lipoprotein Pal [Pseudomonadota bacterium]|jgi:peptidoglycan-associated lipoprotein
MTKKASLMKTAALSLVMLGLLSGCASVSLDDDPAGKKAAAPVSSVDVGAAKSSAVDQPSSGIAGLTAEELKLAGYSMAGETSIFFEFDSMTIGNQYQVLLEQTTKFMKSNAQRALRVEGNTDERGTTEYNLALGQRRAEAVRQALGLLGADDKRIEAISNGEEKPRSTDRTENGFSQNRRADLFLK